jgi:hypothetical protein
VSRQLQEHRPQGDLASLSNEPFMNAQPFVTDLLFPAHADGLALGAHVRACDEARGRTFALRCIGERLHDLLGPRFFTTVFAATLLLTLLAGCA